MQVYENELMRFKLPLNQSLYIEITNRLDDILHGATIINEDGWNVICLGEPKPIKIEESQESSSSLQSTEVKKKKR